MKQIFLLASVLGLAVIPATLFAQESPKRKPGLWEIANVVKNLRTTQCVGAATDIALLRYAGAAPVLEGMNCAKVQEHWEGAKFIMRADCSNAAMRMATACEVTGDFSSQVTLSTRSKVVTNGASAPVTEHKVTLKYSGPCPAGMLEGDISMPDGRVVKVTQAKSQKLGSGFMFPKP